MLSRPLKRTRNREEDEEREDKTQADARKTRSVSKRCWHGRRWCGSRGGGRPGPVLRASSCARLQSLPRGSKGGFIWLWADSSGLFSLKNMGFSSLSHFLSRSSIETSHLSICHTCGLHPEHSMNCPSDRLREPLPFTRKGVFLL